ncbi:bifunctional tetrahydrofolate synthase/dihydrofolate synthase [Thalassotalea litorea]|uniref:Dihydrofolate synthase/folylpolyglutamate synthase n=1 Tax=Thalassotalea litorea TaxID=2020715 RepID=A0A5R9IQQ1_9GAMM|nr:bifunctional tetrahydrofolate synthase/dihydrofolate synthase [Thalassotalea litorea]TLU64218.1 bifunctional tetrahydrofolate synthase/dihydrofolate synthase [Thalassotalea litorea]
MNKQNQGHLSMTTLDEWLFYLESIHSLEIDMTLDRIGEVKNRLNINLDAKKVITVGGTNGKGTSCAFIETALIDLGFRVAVYSSPHIDKFNERLRFNRSLVNDQALIQAFRKIETARAQISLTYYEYTTLAALLICQQSDVDFVLLEVGLGGRLDATNIIDADLSVITSIDLDHQQFLGNDRASIGLEKAGICRVGRPAIIGEPDLPQQVFQYLSELDCVGYYRNMQFSHSSNADRSWQWQSEHLSLSGLDAPYIPQDNVATGLMTLTVLSDDIASQINSARVNRWIDNTRVAGRTELVSQAPDIILDVAHNPHAARHLAKVIAAKGYTRVHAIVGMLGDKDIASTLQALTNQVSAWYPVTLGVPRGATADLLVQELRNINVSSIGFDNVSDGFKIAKENANKNDMILVFGSFFTVAEFKKSCI